MEANADGAWCDLVDGSQEEFIAEHYWGYGRSRGGGCAEYAVEHPRWRVRHAHESSLHCDVRQLYGERFVEALSVDPASAFVADGSAVRVRRGMRI
jgi:hypothetical protein